MKMRDLSQVDDEVLAELAAGESDDPQAQLAAAALFGRYHGRIYQWVRRYIGDHEEALDVSQEVMLSAWRRLPQYRNQGRFFAWLFVITRNRCLNTLRRPRVFTAEEHEVERLPADRAEPDRVLEEKLAEDEILDLIEMHLDGLEQDALYLRCFERMPVDEITRALNIPGAVGARSVLQRARQKLRRALEKSRRNAEVAWPPRGPRGSGGS